MQLLFKIKEKTTIYSNLLSNFHNFVQIITILKSTAEIIKEGRRVLEVEVESLKEVINQLDADFHKVVSTIYSSKGRVVVTGIGKSAIIANKLVATLNSTGTPALFMHAADAIHGDLGMIQKDDVVICISKSGNTPEIKVLAPLLKQGRNILIAMVGNTQSYLAQQAHLVLNCTVSKEACPNNLAPTSSTTAQLALGDALAVCLLGMRKFSSKDFARYHPGGALGKKLYLKVGDISSANNKPAVLPADGVKEIIVAITKNRLGATAVVNGKKLLGIITDGDIRRMLEKHTSLHSIIASDIMKKKPITIDAEAMAVDALEIMRKNKISQIVVTHKGNYAGMVHIHDLNKEGIFDQ